MNAKTEDMTLDSFPVTPSNRANFNIAREMIRNPDLFRLVVFDLPATEGHYLKHAIQNAWTGAVNFFVMTIPEFTDDLRNAIQGGTSPASLRKYEDPDILIVNDFQYIDGKEVTQREFFSILKMRIEAKKLTVIFSERPFSALSPGIREKLTNLSKLGVSM